MRRLVVGSILGVICATIAACGDGPTLSFEFALVNCDFVNTSTPSTLITGTLTVANHGSESVNYELPYAGGYSVTTADGLVVTELMPSSFNDVGCVCAAPTVMVDPGKSQTVAVNLSQWGFLMPANAADLGNPLASTKYVPPGVYDVSILLLHGDRSNAATVTVCAPAAAPDSRYGVCNSPCDPAATSCGASLSCNR